MKKQSFLLLAGAVLTITACNNNANDNQYSDAQIDSMVNARVDELRMQMMAQNDSMINALAIQRADSIILAMKQTNTGAPSKTHSNPKPATGGSVPPPRPNTPVNPKDNRFNGQGSSNTTVKESRFDDKAAEKLKEENAKKKADRFNK